MKKLTTKFVPLAENGDVKDEVFFGGTSSSLISFVNILFKSLLWKKRIFIPLMIVFRFFFWGGGAVTMF